ncbi:putative quinol monooxygenase [Microvirga tunisiensis]|uniref:Antibiotic biosynthesis monooxygenase n=1 Tax=Microvirga tunisiensis TaxID=2108360 RepID=A0A5N7M9U7_9HYPH|nr:putative quinol monooxygenase [Microvirga tunisiensis]MPR05490.1 antibiotic biosynthesis monooxygenase [Microvirga tunisiensis]MPR23691.1 antibiotic biosynthesis monooxygenase [Microvirga tunisiensis]
MKEVSAVAITLAKPGFEDKVGIALEALIAPTRQEKGMLQYEMHRDPKNPRSFVFIERWEDEEDFRVHCGSRHVEAYLKQTDGWIEHSVLYTLEKVA